MTAQATSENPKIKRIVFIGLMIVAAFFGGFGTWAVMTQLDSAAVAPGVLMVESNRKTINHLEGGIVGEILVKEGDRVDAGDLLLRLDSTQPAARLDLMVSRQRAALAREARLIAERDGKAEIDFPDQFLSADTDSNLAAARNSEQRIFHARAKSRAGQAKILAQQIAAYNEEITGLAAQIKAQDRQLTLIASEIKDVGSLFKKGLARKSRMLALEREAADIEGNRAQNQAEIARIRQAIGETQIKINELEVEFINQVVAELAEVQSEVFDLEERVRAADDVLRRTQIVAPNQGVVIGLTAHTVGGVIGPGEPILELVPEGEQLVIDARVDPIDADVVHAGLEAQISFSAFSSRDNKPSKGLVTWVSADGIQDDQTGERYYLARVEIDKDSLQGVKLADLRPGMLADVFILTGAQSPYEYLVGPLMKNLQKSFREN